jgi:quercetin dioxygenase-like cupin family protein
MQVQDPSASQPGPVIVYQAGDSFYESPGGRHLVSANASQSQPAIFTATFVCDHAAPLTTPINRTEPHP